MAAALAANWPTVRAAAPLDLTREGIEPNPGPPAAASVGEQLIKLVNQLSNVFTAVGSAPIQLPQLVVVGSQSSGKSSVLEHIVGRDFLPRGTGIVTRRPLILQLIHTGSAFDEEEDEEEADQQRDAPPEGAPRKHSGPAAAGGAASAGARSHGDNSDEWGEFLHIPGRKFFSFDDIRREISSETDRIAGGKAISAHPISLRIYSPHVLNLTLVDLPGMTKVPVSGQPADIEHQIEQLILSFISSPHALIIAVSAANADLANSDALKIAREVDPTGIRTLGVLTKIDLMDRGTDAMAVLVGQGELALQHGFVGIVARSQEDIATGKPIRDALVAEKQFFASHPVYRSIASRLGTPFLARKLNALLMAQIQSSLPDIRNKISSTIAETTAELESYGSGRNEPEEKGSILLPLLSSYCSHLNDALDGRSPDVSLTELYGGARISWIFRELFTQTLESLNATDLLSDHDIRISIRNASGTRPALFIPEVAFELLVKKQIERLLAPSLDCVELVYHELQRVALQCELLSPELIRFPALRARLLQLFHRLLKSCVDPTKAHIERLVQCELAYINTSHPDFIGGSAAVALIMERIQARVSGKKTGAPAGSHAAAAAAAGAVAADSSGAVDPAQHALLVQSVTGNISLTKHTAAVTSSNSSVHGRSVSVAQPPSTHRTGPGTASSATLGGSSTSGSGWGFPSFFRSPSPSTAATASKLGNSNSTTGSGREGKLPPPLVEHTSQEEHELYPSKPATAASSALGAGASSAAAAPSFASLGSSAAALHGTSASSAASWHLRSLEPSERELVETEVIKILMESYFRIVRKSIGDLVPKTIMAFLVTRMKRELQAELVRELYQPHLLDELLKEADDIAEKRESCKELLDILQRAMDILNSARDYNAMANA